MNYELIDNYEVVNLFFNNEMPFNLKQDLKLVLNKENFKKELLDEVVHPDSIPQRCTIHKKMINGKIIAFRKIRIGSEDTGKSYGLRAIVFQDAYHFDNEVKVLLVHVFKL